MVNPYLNDLVIWRKKRTIYRIATIVFGLLSAGSYYIIGVYFLTILLIILTIISILMNYNYYSQIKLKYPDASDRWTIWDWWY